MAPQKKKPVVVPKSAERYYRIALEQQGPMVGAPEPVDIRAELARRERIKNDDAEQDIVLKRDTLNRLFRLLSIETAAIFVLAVLQATREPWHFHLEDWSFKLLTSVTIVQITAMLFVAVRYLFPKSGPHGRR